MLHLIGQTKLSLLLVVLLHFSLFENHVIEVAVAAAAAAAACHACHHHSLLEGIGGSFASTHRKASAADAVSSMVVAARRGGGGAILFASNNGRPPPSLIMAVTAVSRLLEKRPVLVLGMSLLAHRYVSHQIYRREGRRKRRRMTTMIMAPTLSHYPRRLALSLLLHSDTDENPTIAGDNDDIETDNDTDDGAETSADRITTSAMVASIGFYKKFISPLLPPACRFVPTCSQYGVQAIEKYGPTKGGILTAWRIMRCSPFGGKGYDPPKWPPVFYTYSSY